MSKIYVIQMQEVKKETKEAIYVWEDFYDPVFALEEAKTKSLKLLDDIKEKKVPELFEVSDVNNNLGVCISVYNEKDNTLLDVIEVGNLTSDEWNVKCGSCGAFCS